MKREHFPYVNARQNGFSLVEFMVAITVGVILLAGVLQIYTSSKQISRVEEATARLQENGRYAMWFLSNDIRIGASRLCGGLTRQANVPPTNTLNGMAAGFDFDTGLQGFDATGAGWSPGAPGINGAPQPGTDILTLRGFIGQGTPLTGVMLDNNADVQIVPNNGLFSQGSIVMVENCKFAAIMQITNTDPATTGLLKHAIGAGPPAPGNASTNLSPNNPPPSFSPGDSEVIGLRTVSYFIGPGTNGGLSLRSSVNGAASQELVEGVDDMQILYGEDTTAVVPVNPGDGVAHRYVVAGTAGLDMRRVVSLRISLLLRSLDDSVATQPQTIVFNGANVVGGNLAPPDRRIRRVFTSTVTLMNHTQ